MKRKGNVVGVRELDFGVLREWGIWNWVGGKGMGRDARRGEVWLGVYEGGKNFVVEKEETKSWGRGGIAR